MSNLFTKLFLNSFLCSLCFGPLLFSATIWESEEIAYEDADTSDQEEEEVDCPLKQHTMRVAARHIEAGGIGYKHGYTTLEAFFAPKEHLFSVLPFLDLRGHVFNDGQLAANAGLGIRKRLGNRIYGINSYYDYRNTNHQHYNQYSLGLETLGTRWDVRLNGYLPVGNKKSAPYSTRLDRFSGHSLYLSRKYQYAMKGASAEAGVHFGKTSNFDFYTAAGPYYFIGPMGNHAWGGKVRLSGSYKQYVTLEASDSYDNVFKNRLQGQVTLSYPFGPKISRKNKKTTSSSCFMDLALENRLVQPVGREEIVVVDTHRKSRKAINPATGDPYVFWFVNNQSSSNGTFESPFNLLSNAELASSEFDIIYVYPGDGTSTGLAPITLQNSQKLWGTGVVQHLDTTAGRIKIPVLAQGYPSIGMAGVFTAVTCANNNEISGIFTSSFVGIDCIGITNVLIQNNVFHPNTPSGSVINITDCDGQITLQNNIVVFQTNTAGFDFSSSTPNHANYLIANNQFSDPAMIMSSIPITLGQIASFDSMVIENNTFTTVGTTGIGAAIGTYNPGPGTFGFTGSGSVIVANNTFTGCGCDNTFNPAIVNLPVLAGGDLNITVVNNTWQNSQNPRSSLSVANYSASASTCVKLNANTSDATGTNGAYSLNIGGTAGTSFTADINSNNIGSINTQDITIGPCR